MALSVAAFAISASRPLIYGLLAAMDPASLRALPARRYPSLESETQASRSVTQPFIDMEPDEFVLDARGLREKAAREEAQTISGESFPITEWVENPMDSLNIMGLLICKTSHRLALGHYHVPPVLFCRARRGLLFVLLFVDLGAFLCSESYPSRFAYVVIQSLSPPQRRFEFNRLSH
ncbi:hypothetical protein DFH06DRAFT_59582 [Mycena polygramma]|nr:hypothetical protein DFH06DRAFT_59582 [Mycena polygramma]